MNILIVEDSIGIAEIVSERLREYNYIPHMLHKGLEAIDYIQNNKTDLIILDYSLPDMDAMEIIQKLKDLNASLPPFIIFTGRGDERLAVEMMKMGAHDYLIKDPNLVNRLPEVVGRVLSDVEKDRKLKEAQQSLRESEERFRSFVENSSDLFIKLDNNGILTYVSPNWESLLGYKAQDALGRCFKNFVLGQNSDLFQTKLKEALQSASNQLQLEYSTKHKNGNTLYHAIKGFAVKEGDRIFLNGTIRDITEKHLAENRILKAIVETEEKERKRFAEELHDGIGPLLSAIKLYIEKIKNIEKLSEKDYKLIEFSNKLVNDAVNQIRTIANDLMPSVLQDFGLSKALQSFVNKINQLEILEIEFSSDIDHQKLSQTINLVLYRGLCELINNSLKHSGAKKARLSMSTRKETIWVYYSDDGKGFEFLDTIKGQGMGMRNLKSRVNSLNGSIQIDSKENKGIKVKLEIPIIQD